MPEVDDAFIAMFGIQDGGMDKFRADVRANLDRELKGVLTSRLKADVVQKLVDAYPGLELPPGDMVAEELKRALATSRPRSKPSSRDRSRLPRCPSRSNTWRAAA